MRKFVIYSSHSPINAFLAPGVREKQYEKAREFCGRQAANLFEVSLPTMNVLIKK